MRKVLLASVSTGLAALILSSPGFAQNKLPGKTLGSPMVLKDEGSFFVNGKMITTDYPDAPATGAPVPGQVMINQMYVHYRIPLVSRKYPVIMVHGGGLTGQTYETTPDGREGWATYFVRRGFPVYVVDFPGRGRAGFDSTSMNRAKIESNASLFPAIRRTTAEAAWVSFRFGAALGSTYPGLQFPVKNIEGFAAQGVPYTEATLEGAALKQGPEALVALLDQLGPSILLVHSQSGPFADAVVGMRPKLVKATINVEGNQLTIPTDQQIAAYRNVPDLELFGDNVLGNTSSTGQSRYDGRKAVATRINKAGGKADIVLLADAGMRGNSHMVMQDKNNLKVADYIIKWLDKRLTVWGQFAGK